MHSHHFDPTPLQQFQIRPEMMKINNNLYTRKPSIKKKINLEIYNSQDVPSGLMCPLQIIKWHWTSIIDPSCCKTDTLPNNLPISKIIQMAIYNLDNVQNFEKQNVSLGTVIYHQYTLYPNHWPFRP